MKCKTVAAIACGVLVMSGVGCGDSSGDTGQASTTDQYRGVWSPSAGSLTITCGNDTFTSTVTGNIEFIGGSDSDLVYTDDQGCNFKFNATDSKASVQPGQSCTYEDTSDNGTQFEAAISPTQWSFEQSSDTTLTESLNGSMTLTPKGSSNSVDCNISGTATYDYVGR